MATYFKAERTCEECGERFWGTAKARVCSDSCRGRLWRKQRSFRESVRLADLFKDFLDRRKGGDASWSKLLPRIFRATAAELRRRGWDPFELLLSMPDEPVSDSDKSPGGIEGEAPRRRMWLHPPEREIKMLEAAVAQRLKEGLSIKWHCERREVLERILKARAAQQPSRKAASAAKASAEPTRAKSSTPTSSAAPARISVDRARPASSPNMDVLYERARPASSPNVDVLYERLRGGTNRP